MPSHTAGTEDGIPQQASMLPRRKHDAVVLHEADRDAFTLARGTPLATVITWLEMHRGTVRAAAVTVPQESGRTEWSRPSVLKRVHPADFIFPPSHCGALRHGFSKLPEVRAKQLGALSIPGL
ncbi:hypothetical protein TcG_12379 [Trypanosoma cruzi]|nr:hypothetical protein TcG_12379 [Trypanosoma cruzi]